jgi:hypothetical protein
MSGIKPSRPEDFNKDDRWLDRLCKNQHRYEGEEKSLWRWRRNYQIKTRKAYTPICVDCKRESDQRFDKKRWDNPREIEIAENLIEKEGLIPITSNIISPKIGIPDVLTESEVIEVKQGKNWKHAIGQVLVYKLYYPEHTARIHLFGGSIVTINRKTIEEHCEKLDVKVSWDC